PCERAVGSAGDRARVADPAILAKLAGVAGAAPEPPVVATSAVAGITGMGLEANQVDQRVSPEIARETPGRRLVDPHERRLEHEARLHAEIDRHLERLHRVVTTVGIPRII